MRLLAKNGDLMLGRASLGHCLVITLLILTPIFLAIAPQSTAQRKLDGSRFEEVRQEDAAQTAKRRLVIGAGWGADNLANIEIGRSRGRTVDYRFVCDHTGTVTTVRVFFIFRGPAAPNGYWNGDGGTILVQLETDNGAPNHQPSGTVLSSYTITDPLTPGPNERVANFRLITLSPASVPLTKGNTYHMVFSNIASDPVNNFVSLDDIATADVGANLWPMVSDSTYAMLFGDRPPLVVASRHSPILNVNYDDGYVQGNGDIDSIVYFGVVGGGNISKVEEAFTVDSSNYTVNRLAIRLAPTSVGAGTLTLYDSSLNALASGMLRFPVASGRQSWYLVDFYPPVTLTAKTSYTLVLEMISGSVTPRLLEQGTRKGFKNEGFSQHCNAWKGAAWVGCYGNAPTDLEYYLESVPSQTGITRSQ